MPVEGESEIAELLSRGRAGDQKALAELYDRHRDKLRRMVQLRLDHRLAGRVSASDVLQEAYIDAVKRPSLANQYKVEALGTVVIEYEGRTERVTSDGEQELVNGLNKAVQGRQHKVYFVQGHGERDPDASDRPGPDLG